MLGDLTCRAEKSQLNGNTRLRIYMSSINKDLIYHLYSIFKPYQVPGGGYVKTSGLKDRGVCWWSDYTCVAFCVFVVVRDFLVWSCISLTEKWPKNDMKLSGMIKVARKWPKKIKKWRESDRKNDDKMMKKMTRSEKKRKIPPIAVRDGLRITTIATLCVKGEGAH